MKKLNYIFLAIAAVVLSSCMGKDYAEPDMLVPYGNHALQETNVISIKDLKARYDKVLSMDHRDGNAFELADPTLQIKGIVTANDAGSNIYNEIAVEDSTGGIVVCISQSGIYGYLPVGTKVLIALKDLYIGAYGMQPEIGVPYTNKNDVTYVSRMDRYRWAKAFRILSSGNQTTFPEFDKSQMTKADYMKANCGRVMTIKGVSFSGANGKKTFAPDAEKDAANSVNRSLQGISSRNLVVRTSTYADFAGKPLPQGKVNITGLFTRYSNTWQILIRDYNDIQPAE